MFVQQIVVMHHVDACTAQFYTGISTSAKIYNFLIVKDQEDINETQEENMEYRKNVNPLNIKSR